MITTTAKGTPETTTVEVDDPTWDTTASLAQLVARHLRRGEVEGLGEQTLVWALKDLAGQAARDGVSELAASPAWNALGEPDPFARTHTTDNTSALLQLGWVAAATTAMDTVHGAPAPTHRTRLGCDHRRMDTGPTGQTRGNYHRPMSALREDGNTHPRREQMSNPGQGPQSTSPHRTAAPTTLTEQDWSATTTPGAVALYVLSSARFIDAT